MNRFKGDEYEVISPPSVEFKVQEVVDFYAAAEFCVEQYSDPASDFNTVLLVDYDGTLDRGRDAMNAKLPFYHLISKLFLRKESVPELPERSMLILQGLYLKFNEQVAIATNRNSSTVFPLNIPWNSAAVMRQLYHRQNEYGLYSMKVFQNLNRSIQLPVFDSLSVVNVMIYERLLEWISQLQYSSGKGKARIVLISDHDLKSFSTAFTERIFLKKLAREFLKENSWIDLEFVNVLIK